MKFTVDADNAGTRLDSLVVVAIPRLSRTFARRLCDEGKVTVNGTPNKAGYKANEGTVVEIDYDPSELDDIPHIDLPVIYEDDDCVVINKPAGVLTHAQGVLNPEATVATFLRTRQDLKDVRGDGPHDKDDVIDRAGVVHRLDRATSGVIIGAKNQPALSWLQKQFAQRRVKKTYVAVVEGHLDPQEAVIDMPIERNPKAPATFKVGTNGKSAQTHYKVLKQNDGYSLLELKPQTGRTHQLRVHLKQVGHPIVGDPLYGNGQYGDRLFLHALELEITLPSRERKVFKVPAPKEFNKIVGSESSSE